MPKLLQQPQQGDGQILLFLYVFEPDCFNILHLHHNHHRVGWQVRHLQFERGHWIWMWDYRAHYFSCQLHPWSGQVFSQMSHLFLPNLLCLTFPPRCYQGLGRLASQLKVMSTSFKDDKEDGNLKEKINVVLWVSVDCSTIAELVKQ